MRGAGPALEVIGTEILVCAGLEHVVDGREHRCGNGTDCFLGAAPGARAIELSPGTLDEGGLQPRGAFAHARGAAFAGALVVLGAEARPGDKVRCRGKSAHILADLGKDDAGCQVTDPDDADQQGDPRSKGIEVGLNPPCRSRQSPDRVRQFAEGAAAARSGDAA